MRAIRLCFAGVLMLVGVPSAASAQTANEQGALTINLTDTRGLKVASGTLTIKSKQGKVIYSATTEGPALVQLPYGRYSVEFENAWSPHVSREVVIDKPESFIELASTFVPEGGNPLVSISIKVDPVTSCTADGSLWAKLVGVYSLDEMEQRVTVPGGYALFEPVRGGSYVLMIVDGTKLRAILPVETTRQLMAVTARLSPCGAK